MSIVVQGPIFTEWTKIEDGSATTIFTAQKPTTIAEIGWRETNGGTHSLLIVRNDGSADHVLRGAKNLTAYEEGAFSRFVRLKEGDTIKATSGSSSGYVDMHVSYLAPDAASR